MPKKKVRGLKVEKIRELEEEIELLKIQLAAREKELEEVKKELEDIHASISYKVGRWIAETRIGGWLKGFLRKHVFK